MWHGLIGFLRTRHDVHESHVAGPRENWEKRDPTGAPRARGLMFRDLVAGFCAACVPRCVVWLGLWCVRCIAKAREALSAPTGRGGRSQRAH
eukprot:4627703-Prymnesium_polylepis.1